MNISEILREWAARTPTAPALIDTRRGRERVTTFAELAEAATAMAAQLSGAGLQRGDTVLVFYPMSLELYVVLLALFRLGLTAMFLDPSAGREHMEQCCALHPPQALIASPKAHLLRVVSAALRKIPRKFVISYPLPGAQTLSLQKRTAHAPEIVAANHDTPALITFTSGSTGQPKAALRTHGFLLAQHRVLHRCLSLTTGGIDLTTLPVFVLANLASGVTSVIPDADLRYPGAIDPAGVVTQIQQHRIVSTAASPALLERIADHCLQTGQQLTGIGKIFTGGAPVFPRLLDKLQIIAPRARIVAVYGSTEAEPIAEIPRHEMTPADDAAMMKGHGLLTGRPVTEISVRVLRDQWGEPVGPFTLEQFNQQCVPSGEVGEIVVSGAHVLTGYLHGRGNEETKFCVNNQIWHRTGDAGYFDQTGRLWLLGRCAAKVQDEHGTRYPFAIECAAHRLPGVRRSAFISLQKKRVLIVEPDSAATVNAEQIRQALAWAHIDLVRVTARIPVDKRHNAKVDYQALQKLSG